MAERRRSVRQKSFLKGRVYFNKGRESADCLVRDLTNQGARIIFSELDQYPSPDRPPHSAERLQRTRPRHMAAGCRNRSCFP